ncbi:MAG: AAA family ATPase [Truepera sp.]|nr:AAA family ATPase [Truepera sp.]
MRFLIADSFTKSLAHLSQDLQNQVKQSVFDFQTDPQRPSLQFHRVDRARDKGFWTFRVNDDIRVVVHRQGEDFVYCYADHHDKAYRWAETRRMEIHPSTGAAQLVEIKERVEEVVKHVVQKVPQEPPLFARYDPQYLLALGVPPEWLGALKYVGEEGFLKLTDHLPQEAAEKLMLLAEGHPVPTPTPVIGDPFLHPDAQRRFAVVSHSEAALHQALAYPLDRWMVFLHPTQQALVEKDYAGPAKVSGGAGTGKTVVALHRTAQLARRGKSVRILLTTFSRSLATRLAHGLDRLLGETSAERQRVRVTNLHQLARELYQVSTGKPFTALTASALRDEIERALRATGERGFSAGFLASEWQQVIDAHGIDDFPTYRRTPRAGRGTALGLEQRMRVWKVLSKAKEALEQRGLMSFERLCHEVAEQLDAQDGRPFDHIVADEIQDFGSAELRLLRALVPRGTNDILLVGDDGQRIYKARSSLRASGLEVVGRSSILRLNYRTTEQIRRHADALLPKALVSAAGMSETRTAVSLLRGPDPEVVGFAGPEEEVRAVAEQIGYYLTNGFEPRDIAIFARTTQLLRERAEAALDLCGYRGHHLSEDAPPDHACVSLGTMHRAKGLEFKIVILMGCEAGVLPLPAALAAAPDEGERKLAFEQERNLLYVASTRAREHLVITFAGVPSELLGVWRMEERPRDA